jgi:hypothetical protein
VKSKARADRWNEEVQLVQEEMRRVLAFLEWKAVWWTEEGGRRLDVTPDIADGIRAYASKQAHINRELAFSFKKRWGSASQTQGQDHGDHKQDHEQDEDDLTDSSEYIKEVDRWGTAESDTDMN